jgi:hypothetical protein
MHRTNIYLTDEQRSALADRARAEGTSAADLIRRLIDREFLAEGDDLTAGLAAIDGSFGVLRDEDLDIDRSDGERSAHLERISRL